MDSMETKLARFMAKFYELRTKGKPWLMAVIIGALLLFTFGLYYQAPIGKHLYWYLITPILLSLTGRILYIGIGSLIAAGLGLILVFHSGEFASAGYWQFFLIHVFVTVAMVMDGALLKKKAQEVEETANVIHICICICITFITVQIILFCITIIIDNITDSW